MVPPSAHIYSNSRTPRIASKIVNQKSTLKLKTANFSYLSTKTSKLTFPKKNQVYSGKKIESSKQKKSFALLTEIATLQVLNFDEGKKKRKLSKEERSRPKKWKVGDTIEKVRQTGRRREENALRLGEGVFLLLFFGIFSQLAIGTERTFRWGKIEAKIRDSENVFLTSV